MNGIPTKGLESSEVQPTSAKTIEIDSRGRIWSVAFLVNGKHVVGDGGQGKIRRWRVEDGMEVGTPMDAGSTVYDIAVSRDGKWIVGGRWQLVQAKSGKKVQSTQRFGACSGRVARLDEDRERVRGWQDCLRLVALDWPATARPIMGTQQIRVCGQILTRRTLHRYRDGLGFYFDLRQSGRQPSRRRPSQSHLLTQPFPRLVEQLQTPLCCIFQQDHLSRRLHWCNAFSMVLDRSRRTQPHRTGKRRRIHRSLFQLISLVLGCCDTRANRICHRAYRQSQMHGHLNKQRYCDWR